MAFLDVENTIARKDIAPGVSDLVYKGDPLLAFVKANCLKPYAGGPSWQTNIMYGMQNGGFFASGDTADTSQVQIETGLTLTPRRAWVTVAASLDKIRLELNGPDAVFDYVDLRLQAAALQMSAMIAVALYNDGQAAGRTNFINGLAEALTAAGVTGWTGQTYANYLTVPRSSVNTALDSPTTSPTQNLAGPIDYPTLEQSWNSVVFGTEQPDLLVTTNLGMSYIKMAFQSQQRFEGTEQVFGFRGVKFNGSTIMQSQYCPGTQGVNDPILGNYLSAAGETLWILNTKWLDFYLSTDELMGFGFTGFKPEANSLQVAGQYLFAGNFASRGNRYGRYHFGITG